MSRSWKQTLTGRAIAVERPYAADVDLYEVAVSLGRIARFDGHIVQDPRHPGYSVAQHSVVGAVALDEEGEREAAIAYLLHDAHEYLVGDLATPVLAALDTVCGGRGDVERGFAELKRRADVAIHGALGLDFPWSTRTGTLVAEMDRRMLKAERDTHGAPPPRAWGAAIEAARPLPEGAGAMIRLVLGSIEAAECWLDHLAAYSDRVYPAAATAADAARGRLLGAWR